MISFVAQQIYLSIIETITYLMKSYNNYIYIVNNNDTEEKNTINELFMTPDIGYLHDYDEPMYSRFVLDGMPELRISPQEKIFDDCCHDFKKVVRGYDDVDKVCIICGLTVAA